MRHLVILLNPYGWIEMASVHKLVLKHKAPNVEVATLKPETLRAALGRLVNGDKIHIIGHGGVGTFAPDAGIKPPELAEMIHEGLPGDTKVKIRVDSCQAAIEDMHGESVAKIIYDRILAHQERKPEHITVSGALGASVTGAHGKRIVIPTHNVAVALRLQADLTEQHKQNVVRAKAKKSAMRIDSTDSEIKKMAADVYGEMRDFFKEFAATLEAKPGFTTSHKDGGHKKTFGNRTADDGGCCVVM